MRIFGLLSWFDERPDWLGAAIASLAPFVDHVVALDGAYSLYPQGRPRSPTGQAEAIRESARALGMGCTVAEPQTTWAGNEVEKRSALFRLAEALSTPHDWYFVIDGDALVTDVGSDIDVKRRCLVSPHDCGEITLWNYRQHVAPDERPFVTGMVEEQIIRVMFRAIRGLHVAGKHYIYRTPDGRLLWGDGRDPLEPAEDFTAIRMEHRNTVRDIWRAQDAKTYYQRRDELNIESLV